MQFWKTPAESGRHGDRKSWNFFSLRMRHHAGRPTTAHCSETMGINSTHNGRRTITRKPWIKRKSKREILRKMNLPYLSQLISLARLINAWKGFSRWIFMILVWFECSLGDEFDSGNNFLVGKKFCKKSSNRILKKKLSHFGYHEMCRIPGVVPHPQWKKVSTLS